MIRSRIDEDDVSLCKATSLAESPAVRRICSDLVYALGISLNEAFAGGQFPPLKRLYITIRSLLAPLLYPQSSQHDLRDFYLIVINCKIYLAIRQRSCRRLLLFMLLHFWINSMMPLSLKRKQPMSQPEPSPSFTLGQVVATPDALGEIARSGQIPEALLASIFKAIGAT